MEDTKYCACCGLELPKVWLKIADNFLQREYFDSEELNRFCSEKCICKYLFVMSVETDENGQEKNYEYF